MTDLLEQFEEFYKKYEKPIVEELTVGYSGIDPPINHKNSSDIDHEKLRGLLGGDENGHYHLTEAQLERLKEIFKYRYPPLIGEGQIINTIAYEEITPYEIEGINVRSEEE